MKKDYQQWHATKSSIEHQERRPFFHMREIWFCHFGANVGYEQDGRGDEFLRPVIVYRKFNNEIFWGIPLTTTNKINPFFFPFSFHEQPKANSAILSQLRLIGAKRLSHKIGTISKRSCVINTKAHAIVAVSS